VISPSCTSGLAAHPAGPHHRPPAPRVARAAGKRYHAISGCRPPGFAHQTLRVGPDQILVRWNDDNASHELWARRSLQTVHVRQTRWPDLGPTVVLCYLLRSQVEALQWHASLATRFHHPSGHEALRRFAHEQLQP
jgi:hypothetical protein